MMAQVNQQAEFHRDLTKAAAWTGKLAHDLGNLLTGILGYAELGLDELPAGSVPHRYLKEILRSAQRAVAWARRLQSLGRPPATILRPASLHEAVAAEKARVRPAWGERVVLKVSLEENLPLLAIHTDSLQQALAALLDNAREAISGNGTVAISARKMRLAEDHQLHGNPRPGRYVEIAVADDGCGISPEVRERLFRELFVTTKPRHWGLGLTLVYRSVQAIGGGLCVEPAPGQGTVARLLIPSPSDLPTGHEWEERT
jgi:signal transduction histidine kinase